MTDRLLVARIDHMGYGCVECQGWHDAGSATIPRHPMYDAHLWRQSRHGIQRWTETLCWTGEPLRRVPACEVLPAGEY